MLVSRSRTYPLPVAEAYDAVLATPLPEWLTRWHLALPPVKAVSGEQGAWGTAVGQTRTLHLGDGSHVLETLTSTQPGGEFTYTLTEVAGPMKALVAEVGGRFAFEPAGTGVRITWSWEVTPSSPLGPPAMPLFGWMWGGMATKALDDLEKFLVS